MSTIECNECHWQGEPDQLVNMHGLDEIPENCPRCWSGDIDEIEPLQIETLSAQIRRDPRWFFCEKTTCRMQKAHCAKRQDKGILVFDFCGGSMQKRIPEECRDCSHGREIYFEVTGIVKERPKRKKFRQAHIFGSCPNCGRVGVRVHKKWSGYCDMCKEAVRKVRPWNSYKVNWNLAFCRLKARRGLVGHSFAFRHITDDEIMREMGRKVA